MDGLNVLAKYEVCIFTCSWYSNWSSGWGCEPESWGRRPWRSGMVPLERALVSCYRPSIVTFPLSLRVSEILPLLCSSTPLFPTPPLVSPKCPHVTLGGWPLGYEERMCWAKCPCNNSLQDFQAMWSWSTNVTDGQTGDMQSQYRAMHTVSRDKN